MDFRELVRKKYLKKTSRILEFGPLIRPTATKATHPGIRFADIRSTEDIKKLYTSNQYLKSTGLAVDIDSVVEIDYVVKDSYKETFKNEEKFDVVILSHVIEHMPDIIEFFQDIKNIVNKSGKLIIIYPDARYCFDHFRNGTSFIDAYDVYENKPSAGKRVFDFVYNVVNENDAWLFWNDSKVGDIIPKTKFSYALEAYEKSLDGALPDDTHFWPFSNYQLIKFLYDMDRAGLLDFNIDEFYPTPENNQECMIILTPKKNRKIDYVKYKKLLSSTSPTGEGVSSRRDKAALAAANHNLAIMEKSLSDLRAEYDAMKSELEAIFKSKKWRYSKKIADVKNKIISNGKD